MSRANVRRAEPREDRANVRAAFARTSDSQSESLTLKTLTDWGLAREMPREEAREPEGAGSREPREGVQDHQGRSNVTQIPAAMPVSAVSSA